MAPQPQIPLSLLRPGGPTGPAPIAPSSPANGTSKPSLAFQATMAAATPNLTFSSHALARIERRGIDVGPQTLKRLEDGIDRATSKGSRSTVVFVDGTAFVAAVPNRTVITAVDQPNMRDFVFTNIDSAVIA